MADASKEKHAAKTRRKNKALFRSAPDVLNFGWRALTARKMANAYKSSEHFIFSTHVQTASDRDENSCQCFYEGTRPTATCRLVWRSHVWLFCHANVSRLQRSLFSPAHPSFSPANQTQTNVLEFWYKRVIWSVRPSHLHASVLEIIAQWFGAQQIKLKLVVWAATSIQNKSEWMAASFNRVKYCILKKH